MKIKNYLKEKGETQRHLAARIGIHYMYINQIIRGVRRPSPAMALKIEKATYGAVTRDELLYPELQPVEEEEPDWMKDD